VIDRPAPSAARRLRIIATLERGAAHDDFIAAVIAVGGTVIACDTLTVDADVPGGAMGRLALVRGVVAIRAGESWDAPGRQPPDGSPEVRKRLEKRERDDPQED
jgi:hypothetical protein